MLYICSTKLTDKMWPGHLDPGIPERKGILNSLSFQCDGGISQILPLVSKTLLIAYGICIHILHAPPYSTLSVVVGFYILLLFSKVLPIGNITLFTLISPLSLMVTSFKRSSVRFGTMFKIKFAFLTKLYCLRFYSCFLRVTFIRLLFY